MTSCHLDFHLAEAYVQGYYILMSNYSSLTICNAIPVYFTCNLPGGNGSDWWTLNGVLINNSVDSTGSLFISNTNVTFGSSMTQSVLSCGSYEFNDILTAVIFLMDPVLHPCKLI